MESLRFATTVNGSVGTVLAATPHIEKNGLAFKFNVYDPGAIGGLKVRIMVSVVLLTLLPVAALTQPGQFTPAAAVIVAPGTLKSAA